MQKFHDLGLPFCMAQSVAKFCIELVLVTGAWLSNNGAKSTPLVTEIFEGDALPGSSLMTS